MLDTLNVGEILERMKEVTGCKNYSELSKIFKVRPSTIRNYKNTNIISQKWINHISNNYNVSIMYLIEGNAGLTVPKDVKDDAYYIKDKNIRVVVYYKDGSFVYKEKYTCKKMTYVNYTRVVRRTSILNLLDKANRGYDIYTISDKLNIPYTTVYHDLEFFIKNKVIDIYKLGRSYIYKIN